MTKYARQGPASLGSGKYHGEQAAGGAPAHKI
jgi:cytochrome d ubiquinol oxidase subunit I